MFTCWYKYFNKVISPNENNNNNNNEEASQFESFVLSWIITIFFVVYTFYNYGESVSIEFETFKKENIEAK